MWSRNSHSPPRDHHLPLISRQVSSECLPGYEAPLPVAQYSFSSAQNSVAHLNPHLGRSAMTSPPFEAQNFGSKLHMDARAAMLKEQLLKSKSGRTSRDSPQLTASDHAMIAIASEKKHLPTTSSSYHPPFAKSPSFMPHLAPKQQPETSVQADANDIAALISSISSASHDEEPAQTPQIAKPTLPANDTVPDLSEDLRAPETAQLAPNKPPSAEAKPIQPQPPAVKGEIMNGSAVGLTGANWASSAPGRREQAPVPQKTLLTPDLTAGKNGPCTETSLASSSSGKPAQNGRIFERRKPPPTASNAETAHAPEAGSGSAAGRCGTGNIALPKPNQSVPDPSGSRKNDPAGKQLELRHRGNEPAYNGPASQGLDLDQQLAELLARDSDLLDWLTLTQYFDVEARTRKLTRYRKLAEMDAEQKRIQAEQQRLEAERQKLFAEDELERSTALLWQTSAPIAFPTREKHSSSSITAPCKTESTSAPSAPASDVKGSAGPPRPAPATAKRELESIDETTPARSAKVPKLENQANVPDDSRGRLRNKDDYSSRNDPRLSNYGGSPRETRSSLPNRPRSPGWYRPRSVSRGAYAGDHRRRSRSPFYPREPSPRRPLAYLRSPSRADPGDYDTYRGGFARGGRQSPPPRYQQEYSQSRVPKHIDLGVRGDTRFFMVKSFNEDNVKKCMEDGVWTTQAQNGEMLTNAFKSCKNVILFFSINKSRAFQGYARMATTPSSEIWRPKWMSVIHWETTDPFRVEWLSTTEVEFFRVGHLKNSLNDNQAVLVGKDGQEIEEDCGRELLAEMESIAQTRYERAGAASPRTDVRPRGGGASFRGGRGGRGGKRPIKFDDDRGR